MSASGKTRPNSARRTASVIASGVMMLITADVALAAGGKSNNGAPVTVAALSVSAIREGHIALAETDSTLWPEAIHWTIDVAELPVQEIDEMSVVFSTSNRPAR